MTSHRSGRTVPAISMICAFLLTLAGPAGAQGESEMVDARDFVDESEESIDEITVVGQRSLVIIERQIERADLAMYSAANALIDDPLYRTYCRLETSPGTRIKRRVCAAGFERELMSEAWEDDRALRRAGETNYSNDYRLTSSELREHREILKQKMIDLAGENPELAEAIYERARLQRDYEAERERRREKDE